MQALGGGSGDALEPLVPHQHESPIDRTAVRSLKVDPLISRDTVHSGRDGGPCQFYLAHNFLITCNVLSRLRSGPVGPSRRSGHEEAAAERFDLGRPGAVEISAGFNYIAFRGKVVDDGWAKGHV